MIEFTKNQWAQLESQAEKVFRAKERRRLIDARKPMAEKIKDVIRMQKMSSVLNPRYRNILPWRPS